MSQIDERILQNIARKVQTGIVSPAFNMVLNYALQPLYKKLEKALMGDFNELKKRALAYGEYDKRFSADPSEKTTEFNAVKEYLLSELSKLQVFKSPIKELDLEKIPKEGKLELVIDGKKEVLDMSKEEDRNKIRDLIGSQGVRLLPGDPPRISRPNYAAYLHALNSGKQLNKFDMKLIADKEGRPIQIHNADGTVETVGPEGTGKAPMHFKLENEHFMPMVENASGELETVKDVENKENACGAESAIFLTKRQELIDRGMSAGEATDQAKAFLKDTDSTVRDDYMKSVANHAIKQPHLYTSYTGREHETSNILGGTIKKINATGNSLSSNLLANILKESGFQISLTDPFTDFF